MSTREDELLRRVEGLIADTQRDAERVRRQDADRAEQRAAAARSGDLGPDWQQVQRRIDSGQTTLQDVFGGGDETPAAVRLRERSRATIEAMEIELPPELADEVAAARTDLDHLTERP